MRVRGVPACAGEEKCDGAGVRYEVACLSVPLVKRFLLARSLKLRRT